MKDIRDIAAYWGSPCINAWVNMRGLPDSRVVNAAVLESLEANASPDLKVCLRPISSLTDDELTQCIRIDRCNELNFKDVRVKSVNRNGSVIQAFYGEMYVFRISKHYFHDPYIKRPIEIASYLQSIHVYIPGTINEKYVQLTI